MSSAIAQILEREISLGFIGEVVISGFDETATPHRIVGFVPLVDDAGQAQRYRSMEVAVLQGRRWLDHAGKTSEWTCKAVAVEA